MFARIRTTSLVLVAAGAAWLVAPAPQAKADWIANVGCMAQAEKLMKDVRRTEQQRTGNWVYAAATADRVYRAAKMNCEWKARRS